MTALPLGVRGWLHVGPPRPWAVPSALAGTALAVGALSAARGSEPIEVLLTAAFSSVFAALARTDLECRVIPNRLVYPALVLALAVSGAWPDRGLVAALTGGLGALFVAMTVRALSRGGLGGGGVKMATLAGAVVGYPSVLLAGLVTTIAGGLTAVTLVAAGRAERGTRLTYGPFIALGAAAALLR